MLHRSALDVEHRWPTVIDNTIPEQRKKREVEESALTSAVLVTSSAMIRARVGLKLKMRSAPNPWDWDQDEKLCPELQPGWK